MTLNPNQVPKQLNMSVRYSAVAMLAIKVTLTDGSTGVNTNIRISGFMLDMFDFSVSPDWKVTLLKTSLSIQSIFLHCLLQKSK